MRDVRGGKALLDLRGEIFLREVLQKFHDDPEALEEKFASYGEVLEHPLLQTEEAILPVV